MIDLFVIALVLVLVFISNKRIAESFGPIHAPWYKRSLDRLFVYHCIFICLFPLIPGDAIGYWNFGFQQLTVHSDKMIDYFGVGTTFLLYLDFVPAKLMGLSFFTGNVLYGVLGFFGLRYLFLIFVGTLKVNIKILGLPVIPYLFYLPNMNFWTAGIGKDTLCFFGIAWFFYALLAYRKKYVQLIVAFLLVYYIRPHMGMMIIAGTGSAILFSRDMKPVYKVLFVGVAIWGFFFVYSKVATFLMVSDLNVATLSDLAKDKASLLSTNGVGSAVDIKSYSVPVRLFTYLYRPLFFDVHNLITLMSFLENMVYMFITWVGIRAFRWKNVVSLPLWQKASFIVFLLAMIVFANSLGNLGIIMREKNMTMIYLLMTCIWMASRRKETDKMATA